MDFTDNADDGKVNIFFSFKIESYESKKRYIEAYKVWHLFVFVNIDISFDANKISMTFTVFQSG